MGRRRDRFGEDREEHKSLFALRGKEEHKYTVSLLSGCHDMLFSVNDRNDINRISTTFKSNSILKFTFGMEDNNKLPFLDLLVERGHSLFSTRVYVNELRILFER